MFQITTQTVQIVSVIISILSFMAAIWLYRWVKALPAPNKCVLEIGEYIRQGANTFLKREYLVLTRFTVIAAVLILVFLPKPIWSGNGVTDNIWMSIAYISGTILSALAGKIGIHVATIANIKTANASRSGVKPSFMAGFRGGAVIGMSVVGVSLLGVTLIFILTGDTGAILGFSFGASSLALFAKTGGGIFTKTADISADLVGKVEFGLEEDDPRNPAVIADNVGDNVGDIAGMGADLFDSNVASMSAALVIATSLGGLLSQNVAMVFAYAALGLLSSIIGIATAKIGEGGSPGKALNSSTYVTTATFIVLTSLATWIFGFEWRIWGATFVGLVVGVAIGFSTNFFTEDTSPPVRAVASASKSGSAFTILSGLSYGLLSTAPALIGIATTALIAYNICAPLGPGYGMFGIAMSALGMLSIVGMIMSNDAFGPIVDNARGLAVMGGLGEEAVGVTDRLASAGNTVKAVTKGFSISAAGLTVISLLGAFMSEVNVVAAKLNIPSISNFAIMKPTVFFGLIIGVAVPAVFSAMLMLGVDKNAQKMIKEIHRQFNDIPDLKEGKKNIKPDYERCIEISTNAAIKELIPAGTIAILATIAVGFIGGVEAIGGFLTGNIASGLLLALLMSNSGGLWDNSKKYIESGHFGGKGSPAHKATVIGDTVGDPFKDTAGPSVNTQITVVSLVSSMMSTLFLIYSIF